MGGFSIDKLLVIGGLAVVLIGPQRLPVYAAKLAQFVRSMRRIARGARGRVREEVGAELYDEIDWKRLNPRRYDPRTIIRDALTESPGEDG